MKVYDKRYSVMNKFGTRHIAYFRKGEDYDWWEDEKTKDEVINVVDFHEIDRTLLNDKQLSVINWMFNYCMVEMLKRNDEHSLSDINKLAKNIDDRFPEHTNKITETLI